jgi:hypothetical protein
MSAITTDGAALAVANGAFLNWAVDRSIYLFGTAPQVFQWAAESSTTGPIILALRAAGFSIKPIGGGPEYVRGPTFNETGRQISTDVPLTYWEGRSS